MIYNSNRKTTIAIRLENKSYHDGCCKIIFWFIGSPQAHTMPHPVHRQSLVPHRYVVFSKLLLQHGDDTRILGNTASHHISRIQTDTFQEGHCFPGNCLVNSMCNISNLFVLCDQEITSDSAKTLHMLLISIFSLDCRDTGRIRRY